MNKCKAIILILPLLICLSNGCSKAEYLSDEQIKKLIIQESIYQYPGNCPCPYNSASNGSRCGKRSAYNRAGGYNPICYPEDVTREMIKKYKQKNK